MLQYRITAYAARSVLRYESTTRDGLYYVSAVLNMSTSRRDISEHTACIHKNDLSCPAMQCIDHRQEFTDMEFTSPSRPAEASNELRRILKLEFAGELLLCASEFCDIETDLQSGTWSS